MLSWWHVNLGTTYLNVPLATVHHLYNVIRRVFVFFLIATVVPVSAVQLSWPSTQMLWQSSKLWLHRIQASRSAAARGWKSPFLALLSVGFAPSLTCFFVKVFLCVFFFREVKYCVLWIVYRIICLNCSVICTVNCRPMVWVECFYSAPQMQALY